ncbi:ATP-binding cassette domain-containing protein [Streptomyces sp. M10(2022)]
MIGLVGANGAGKSSLLRLLAGLDRPEEGELRLSPPSATVGHLPQEPERRAGRASGTSSPAAPGWPTPRRRWTQPPRHWSRGRRVRMTRTPRPWSAGSLGGADLDERAEEIAADLGLTTGLDLPMTALSGGQAARAGLASLLLSRYDVFLLDEPTNDLDLEGLERLERFVSGLRAGTVVVSHDREFLMRTVTKVLELDLAQQQINLYGGGYAAYLEERERARTHAREEFDEYSDKRSALEGRAQMQRAGWTRASRTPAARPPTTTRSAASSAARPARSRRRRPSRPSA